MAKFKQLVLNPYISDNIYLDLNIDNLIQMYEKARKELDDINKFFNIRSQRDSKLVLLPPVNRRAKKHELRILFEELCFTSKLNYQDVSSFLKMLDDRVKEIESAIDHHFDLIK